MRCEAPSRLFSSYSMRPRKIFVLLYIERELLKQKLQTKNYKSLRTNQNLYFLKLLQTLIKQPGSALCFSLVLLTTCQI